MTLKAVLSVLERTHGQLGSTNPDEDEFTRFTIVQNIGISLILCNEWRGNHRSASLNKIACELNICRL